MKTSITEMLVQLMHTIQWLTWFVVHVARGQHGRPEAGIWEPGAHSIPSRHLTCRGGLLCLDYANYGLC